MQIEPDLKMLFAGYVDEMKKLLFSLDSESREEIAKKYAAQEPGPLVQQFEGRIDKKEAVKKYEERKGREIVLYPTGDIFS